MQYYTSYCRPCTKKRNSRNTTSARIRKQAKLWAWYRKKPCVGCGETNPIKLSLDHISDKTFNIGDGMNRSWGVILEELERCEVRCHNCHAVKTAATMGWYKSPKLRKYLAKWPENKEAFK